MRQSSAGATLRKPQMAARSVFDVVVGDRRSRRVAHRFIGRGERAGGDPDSANATHVRAVDGVRRRYAGADRVIDTVTVYGDGCAIVERSASATSIFGRRALKRRQQRSSSGSRVE